MGFDIRRCVSRLRCHYHIINPWSWSGPGYRLAMVFDQSIANNFWHGRRDMAGRHPMAVVSFRRIFGRAPSDQMGWHPHRGGFRDTAHGLLAWALATLLIAVLVTLGSAATAGVAAAAASAPSGTPVSPEAADQARKIAVAFAFTTSLSLLIGAFVASAAGALGGFIAMRLKSFCSEWGSCRPQ